jgi:hypothetical protein
MLAVSEILDSLDDVSREFNQQTTSSAEYIEFKVRSLWLCATKGKTSVFCLLSAVLYCMIVLHSCRHVSCRVTCGVVWCGVVY